MQTNKILAVLVSSETNKSYQALSKHLDKEYNTIYETSEDKYLQFIESINNILIISNRLHKESFEIAKHILKDTEEGKFQLTDEPFNKDYYRSNIISKIFDVFVNLKYELTEDVFNIAFKCLNNEFYSKEEKDTISKKIIEASKYDLDIIKKHKDALKIQNHIIDNVINDENISLSLRLSICDNLLSSSIEDVESKGRTISFADIPFMAFDDELNSQFISIRNKVLDFLIDNYKNIENKKEKLSIRTVIEKSKNYYGTREHPKTLKEIQKNTLRVLIFYKDLVTLESDKEILQDIEGNVFWTYYHNRDTEDKELENQINNICLEIRELLYSNKEFDIFRHLIGFESRFGSWEEYKENESSSGSKSDEIREAKALRYIVEEFEGNEKIWKSRIIEYSQIQSNDMCTFPIFMYFLKELSAKYPEFIIDILIENKGDVSRFLARILEGLLESEIDLTRLYEFYIDKQINLGDLAFAFSRNNIDTELSEKLIIAIYEVNDIKDLSMAIKLLITKNKNLETSTELFNNLIEKINSLDIEYPLKTRWINEVSYLDEMEVFCSKLNDKSFDVLVDNMKFAPKLDYRWKFIFKFMLQKDVNLFLNLLKYRQENKKNDELFDSLSYDLTRLNLSLDNYVKDILNQAKSWYLEDTKSFSWKLAPLVNRIIYNINIETQVKFKEFIKENNTEEDLDFMYSLLLNNYHTKNLYSICKELSKHYNNEEAHRKIYSILSNTGLVSGPHGMSDAYFKKIEDVKPWLDDSNENVRAFAKVFIEHMTKSAQSHREREDKEKAVDDYIYGDDLENV